MATEDEVREAARRLLHACEGWPVLTPLIEDAMDALRHALGDEPCVVCGRKEHAKTCAFSDGS